MASNLKVDIVKPTATNGSLSLKGDSGGSATANGISVDSSGDTSITGTTTIVTADINGGTIDGTTIGGTTPAAGSFTSVDATSDVTISDKIVHSGDTNTAIRFPAADTVTVETSGSERMRIDSSGNVGIGTSSYGPAALTANRQGTTGSPILTWTNNVNNSGHLHVLSTGAGITADGFFAFGSNETGNNTFTEQIRIDTSGNLLVGYTSSNGSYKLQVNSQIFATSSTIATSDGNYKENVKPLTGILPLVLQFNPVQFDWKEHSVHEFDRNQPTVGFIAQEVQQILTNQPYLNSIVKSNECVIEPEETDEDGNVIKEAVTEEFLGIAEGNMIALLTKSIQEQQTIIESQQAQIDALSARLDALENQKA